RRQARISRLTSYAVLRTSGSASSDVTTATVSSGAEPSSTWWPTGTYQACEGSSSAASATPATMPCRAGSSTTVRTATPDASRRCSATSRITDGSRTTSTDAASGGGATGAAATASKDSSPWPCAGTAG